MNETLEQLRSTLTGRRKPARDEIHEAQENMAHVSWLLILIFILYQVLTIGIVGSQLKDAQQEVKKLENRLQEVMESDPGQIYLALEENLIDLQRQRLTQALDTLVNRERQALALDIFTIDDGVRVEDLALVLLEDRIGDNFGGTRFSRGCLHSQAHLATPKQRAQLAHGWEREAMRVADLTPGGSKEAVVSQPLALTPENEAWLKEEVSARIAKLHEDCRTLHTAARNALCEYYGERPREIQDEHVSRYLSEYENALNAGVTGAEAGQDVQNLAEKRLEMLTKVDRAILEYVAGIFAKRGAPLLVQ